MSIEAMKRVVEAFDDLPPDHPARYANLQINALRTAIQQAEAKTDERAAFEAEMHCVPVGQAPSVWNSIQIASWIGSQLMHEPSMFERNAVCKFVRSLGRHPTLLKHSPKDTHTAPGVPDALKDHQIAAMVNSLRDIALQFHGHDSLRERIANVLVPALKAEGKTDEPIYQICKADSVSVHSAWVDVDKQAYDDAGLYPEYRRRVLYTHPAPGVTDDVARDAERYRWLRAYYHNSEDIGICKWVDEGWSGQWVLEHDPDTSIDAAMLTAQEQKGD